MCGLCQGRCGAAEASQAQRAGYPGWGGLGLRLNPVASHGPMGVLWQAKQVWRSPGTHPGGKDLDPQSSNSSRFPWEAGAIWQQRNRAWSLNPGLGKGGGHKYRRASRPGEGTQEPRAQARLSSAQHSGQHQNAKESRQESHHAKVEGSWWQVPLYF